MVSLLPRPRRRFERLCFGLLVAWSGTARADDAPGLVLETGSPDALCPDLTQAREAVARRLGSLEVEGRRGWRARYTIGHAPAGSPRHFVRLELFNAEGRVELSRDLPMRGESCSTMAEVIALVLERHFRSLSPEERDSSPGDELFSASSAATERSSARATAPSASPSAVPARPFNGLVGAEYALALERPLALGLRALGHLGGAVHLGGVLLLDLRRESERLPMAGEARSRRAELRVWVAWGAHRHPWLGYAGPSLGVTFERGETRNLPEQSALLRALWAGGLEAGGAFCVSRRFALHGALSLTYKALPLSGRFYVDDREVLRREPLQLQLGLGAGYAF